MKYSPNPVSDNVPLTLTLPETGVAALDIISSRGESVFTVFAENEFTRGTHTMSLNITQLAAGTYFCRLTVQGRSFVQPLVISR
jgi:Secretion system C-terminal sorting domain